MLASPKHVRQFSHATKSLAHPCSTSGTDLHHAADVQMAVAGRGSYGSVYKAQVRGTQEVVAVKVIPLGDKDEVLEIQKEIEMLKECNHPNVVRYLVCCSAVTADTHPFMAGFHYSESCLHSSTVGYLSIDMHMGILRDKVL